MFSNNLIAGAAGQPTGFYPNPIDQSLRFNDNDSAYLSRTPASAGNRKTWTWSGWVKRGNLTDTYRIFGAYESTSSDFMIRFISTDKLEIKNEVGGVQKNLQTTRVFRDTSAWYHIVVSVDFTQATSTDRVKLYINGNHVTDFSLEDYHNQNTDTLINKSGQELQLGSVVNIDHFDGYLAEVHFTDGTAYDADAFGEFKEGVWVAKAPSVTYGTNGFYLDFANSADIGNDVSGEGNDWTPNNFTASDVVLDSPTNNFCTFNPLVIRSDVAEQTVFSEGNLKAQGQSSGGVLVVAQGSMHFGESGKYYFEVEIVSSDSASAWQVGIDGGYSGSGNPTTNGVYYREDGDKRVDSVNSSYGASYTAGDIIGVAVSIDDDEVEFFKNNVSQGVISHTLNSEFVPQLGVPPTADQAIANFGQLGFTYTPPTGYLALSTANLPDPAIDPAQGSSPEDYFNTVLYTGDGTDNRFISAGFDSDLLWVKSRNNAYGHVLFDAVRGNGNYLSSSSTNAENAGGTLGWTNSGTATGGFVVDAGTNPSINGSGATFAAWNWKANGSGVSNTDGSITSTVSANTESGFSIVSWIATNGAATIGHGLDSAPEMILVKSRDSVVNWTVYHESLGNTGGLVLNNTNAFSANIAYWNNTSPTSNVFSVGSFSNYLTDDMIAYCFHSVEGFSKFGSYTGNGSTDGPFVYTGFRPAFVMVKRTDSTGNWIIHDTQRNTYNVINNGLYPNTSDAESTGWSLDFTSNGFKQRTTGTWANASGGTYIYACFSENPFKYSLAR